jgi:hypothetical protein
MALPTLAPTHAYKEVPSYTDWNALANDINFNIVQGADVASAATIAAAAQYQRLTGVTTVNTITAPVAPIGPMIQFLVVSGLTFGSVGQGSGGNIKCNGDQNASVPALTLITFRWDSTDLLWYEVARTAGNAVVNVATTIAGLGAGTPGKIGHVRLMPTTYNNGGALALPAATITVGTTAGFATAGTLTTPNGIITYTGITATTFTGCTGGVGTLSAGAAIAQASVTSGTADYEFAPVIYDSVVGKWMSIASVIGQFMANQFAVIAVAGAWAASTTTNGHAQTLSSRWRWYDFAGLKPQARWMGGLTNGTATNTNAQIRNHWYCADFKDAIGGMFDNGADAASAGNVVPTVPTQGATGAYALPAVESLWSVLPGGYTLKDNLLAAIDLFATATTGGSTSFQNAALWLRWIG